jgi:hypothetical protein
MNRRCFLFLVGPATVTAILLLLSSCGTTEKSGYGSDEPGMGDDRADFRSGIPDEDRLGEAGLSFDTVDSVSSNADRDDLSGRDPDALTADDKFPGDASADELTPDRKPRDRKLSPELETIVAGFMEDRKAADAAFRWLCFIDPDLIPECLDLVTSNEPTRLERIRVIVRDKKFVEHGKFFLVSDIPGMGLMEEFDDDGQPTSLNYTKKSYNTDRRGKGYIVVVDNLYGFPLGVVVRAALLNRIQSRRFPTGIDHRRHLRSWWRSYYRNVKRVMDQRQR